MTIVNKTQLITYADSLGGSLAALRDLLEQPLEGLFHGVHILPPFPSSGDRGFAPVNYFEIDPRFGGWEDIRQIGARHDVVVDLMANHISRHSPYFQDFLQRGRVSPHAAMFLTLEKIWPEGQPRPEDVAQIFLRRPHHPFLDVPIAETGEVERVWATFGTADWAEAIDLDVNHPATRRFFSDVLAHLAQNNVNMVRLDAVAFVIKKPGTSCFFVEPEIYAFLDWISAAAQAVNIELLPEVHGDFVLQEKLAERGFWVYNFVLPLVVLHSLVNKNGRALIDHLRSCPRRQITMLDCHDGIPVQPDIVGILPLDDAQRVVQVCLERGANLSRIMSDAHKQRPDFDAHQINISYYAALNADDDAYLAARAIQFFAPGVPQVYYHGLLAGANCPEEVQRQGDRRAINRPNYAAEEVLAALERPVVQRLVRLIRLRNTHPAFDGALDLGDSEETRLNLTWRSGEDWCRLRLDLLRGEALIEYREPDGSITSFVP